MLFDELTEKLGKTSKAKNRLAKMFGVGDNMMWKYLKKGAKPSHWGIEIARKNNILPWWKATETEQPNSEG
jgi:hypothetical protein